MKKITLLFLCLLIIISFASCNTKTPDTANESNTTDDTSHNSTNNIPKENPVTDFQYEFSSDGKVVYINKYIGKSKHVVIPSTIEGVPVVSLKGFVKDGVISAASLNQATSKQRLYRTVLPQSVYILSKNAKN